MTERRIKGKRDKICYLKCTFPPYRFYFEFYFKIVNKQKLLSGRSLHQKSVCFFIEK